MSILVRTRRTPGHDLMRVFIGPDDEHRALAGALIMRPAEAAVFRSALGIGAGAGSDCSVDFESAP